MIFGLVDVGGGGSIFRSRLVTRFQAGELLNDGTITGN